VPAAAPAKVWQSARNYTPLEMLRTPGFYLLYLMFVLVAASGLMAVAQIAPIANDYKIADVPIDLVFFSSATLTVALVFDNILNGLARPFFGWLSDHVGRENVMAIVFTLGAAIEWAIGNIGSSRRAVLFIYALEFFTWGEIFSLFPSTCTDMYGARYATTNAGLLYTAKGAAAWIVPLANVLKSYTGNWHAVFLVAASMNVAVAILALLVLKPMRSVQHAKLAAATAE
jgi:OFA family oxalate/formate antiporter-like MFS transporter